MFPCLPLLAAAEVRTSGISAAQSCSMRWVSTECASCKNGTTESPVVHCVFVIGAPCAIICSHVHQHTRHVSGLCTAVGRIPAQPCALALPATNDTYPKQ